jgi:2'-5' RNA ligase
VWPPASVVEAVAAAVGRLRSSGATDTAALRWTGREQWPVTLRFLGDADPSPAIAALRSAALQAGSAPATAVMGPATGRFGRRVLHVPVAGLGPLAVAVGAATAGVGEPPDERAFSGHLTLARARRRGGVDLGPLAGHPLSGRWPVSEVTLVASRPAPRGASYQVIDAVTVEGPCPNARSELH